jgi:acyl carrier protein phosphodiesterase
MNFLAHLYLSGTSEDIMFGNFIGDFVKGNAYEDYPEGVRKGILLHRKIDYYTDHHAAVSMSKDLLRENYRHYAGVIVDIYYDHFLARYWQRFHPHSLLVFSEEVYRLMLSRKEEMPPRAAHMLSYMAADNWLLGYATTEGIQQALSGMARRTKFTSHMEKAVKDLKMHYEVFHSHFNMFFPDIIQEIARENDTFIPPKL